MEVNTNNNNNNNNGILYDFFISVIEILNLMIGFASIGILLFISSFYNSTNILIFIGTLLAMILFRRKKIWNDISFVLSMYSYFIMTLLLARELKYYFDISYVADVFDTLNVAHNKQNSFSLITTSSTSLLISMVPLNIINWNLMDGSYDQKMKMFKDYIAVYTDFIFSIGIFSLGILLFDPSVYLSKENINNSILFLIQFVIFQCVFDMIHLIRTLYVFCCAIYFLAYVDDIYNIASHFLN